MRKSQLPYRLTLGTWLLLAGVSPVKVALADDILAVQYYEQALQAYR